jgi:hypothetical protein
MGMSVSHQLNDRHGTASTEAMHETPHSPSQTSTAIPERREDHKYALRKHLQRFHVQLIGWGLKIAVAAASVPLFMAYAQYQSGLCHDALRHSTGCRLVLASQFIPTLLFLGLLIVNFIYHLWQYHRWEVAMANAKEFADRESVAKGWTEVFSIYVRSKRRSYHVMTWGLIAVLYAIIGLAGEAVVLSHGTSVSISWFVPLANAVAGCGLLFVSYLLGTAYLPGDVIVRHTLALLIYAISNITDPNLAKHQAAQEADEFVRTNPWWFYSH